jgi:enamine deaminase RidA (YjgF/YER057c/UK114 family)
MREAVNVGGPRRLGFSDAVRVPSTGSLLFISGQTSRDGDGAVAGVGDPAAQMTRVLERLDAVLRQVGGESGDVVQVRVLLRNIADWSQMEPIFDRYWGEVWPACTLFEVDGLFDENLLVEIEGIAVMSAVES